MHSSKACNNASSRGLALVLVVGNEEPDLEEPTVAIAESLDALSGGQLALPVLAGRALRAAPFAEARLELTQLGTELSQTRRHAFCRSRSANQPLM